jgi:hypothetical protein
VKQFQCSESEVKRQNPPNDSFVSVYRLRKGGAYARLWSGTPVFVNCLCRIDRCGLSTSVEQVRRILSGPSLTLTRGDPATDTPPRGHGDA